MPIKNPPRGVGFNDRSGKFEKQGELEKHRKFKKLKKLGKLSNGAGSRLMAHGKEGLFPAPLGGFFLRCGVYDIQFLKLSMFFIPWPVFQFPTKNEVQAVIDARVLLAALARPAMPKHQALAGVFI